MSEPEFLSSFPRDLVCSLQVELPCSMWPPLPCNQILTALHQSAARRQRGLSVPSLSTTSSHRTIRLPFIGAFSLLHRAEEILNPRPLGRLQSTNFECILLNRRLRSYHQVTLVIFPVKLNFCLFIQLVYGIQGSVSPPWVLVEFEARLPLFLLFMPNKPAVSWLQIYIQCTDLRPIHFLISQHKSE